MTRRKCQLGLQHAVHSTAATARDACPLLRLPPAQCPVQPASEKWMICETGVVFLKKCQQTTVTKIYKENMKQNQEATKTELKTS
jgi:hypothetical protein